MDEHVCCHDQLKDLGLEGRLSYTLQCCVHGRQQRTGREEHIGLDPPGEVTSSAYDGLVCCGSWCASVDCLTLIYKCKYSIDLRIDLRKHVLRNSTIEPLQKRSLTFVSSLTRRSRKSGVKRQ